MARATEPRRIAGVIALVILTLLLALVCVASSLGDWKGVPQILESLDRLKVPFGVRPALPILKTLGAIAILIGLKMKGLGAAGAAGLAAYFAGAVWFHMRAKDAAKEALPAFVLMLLALAVLALRLAVSKKGVSQVPN
jgi:uncharacterized membrane protein YphA (DoxX/SURF4 family)